MKKYYILFLFFCALKSNAQQPNIIQTIDALLADSKYAEAIQMAENGKANNQNIIYLLDNKIAEALIRSGKFDEAKKNLERLLELEEVRKNNITNAITESNLGFLFLNQGRNDLAFDYLQRSVAILTESENGLHTAQALAYLAQVSSSTGNYAQAEEYLRIALSIRQKLLPENHELIAASYNDLGVIFSQTDADKALDYFDQAIARYTSLHGSDHPKIAIAKTNSGLAYNQLKLYGDAINNFEEALTIWNKLHSDAHPTKAFVLNNMGLTYSQMGDLKAASGYFEQALNMYEISSGKKHPDVASTLNLIGNVKKAQDNFSAAIQYYQQAIVANVADFNSLDVESTPGTRQYYNGNVLLYSLMYKAQALEAQYLTKSLRQQDLDLALHHIMVCDTLIDRLRQQSANESDKIGLGALANEIYADGVRISYMLHEVAFKKKHYRESAFYFAEKSKSAVLLDAISDTNAKSFAGIPENVLEEEKDIKAALALINQKLSQKPSEEEESYLRESAFTLNQHYRNFITRLEKEYPDYYNLKFNTSAPSIAKLQERIDTNTSLISYFIDENNKRLYTFRIEKNKVSIHDAALVNDYDKYITGLRNSLYYSDPATYARTAIPLSKLLIPKLSSRVKHLIIIPTGRMSILPFEVLLTKNVKVISSFDNLPYLVKRVSLRYEFSAGLILQKEKSEPSQTKSVMLCAPVTFAANDQLPELPGTESEVKTIAGLFQKNNASSEIMLNQDANESALKHTDLKQYNIIHFATHGVVDEQRPELSRIYLQTNTEAEDGHLYSGEIYNLELNAELVTLSACQTGLGKISKGEGVIGLSRALVYAGAKNLVVSFWSVADQSTAELMTDFYKRSLQSNSDYATSLQQAKLEMLKGKYAAPYYWAPFILIGF